MIRKFFAKIIILVAISNGAMADNVNNITWIAQNYMPYSYVNDNSQNTGMAIDIAVAIMQKIGSNQNGQNIQLHDFSRSFIRSNNDTDTVFFPLLKLPARASYFTWVGPIDTYKPVLFAKKTSNIVINNPANDMKNYIVAGKEGDNGVDQLENLNVSSSSIMTSSSDEANILKLKNGEVNLVVCNEASGLAIMKKLGLKAKDYQVVYRLQENGLYFAFNNNTSNDLIVKIQQAFDSLKSSKAGTLSEYDQIRKKYEN